MEKLNKRKPVALDLFCGCGGLTLGLKQAGFKVIGGVDIDSLSIEAYRANHPDTFVWETDIRNLSVSQVMSKLGLERGDLDLLAGCPPCQGFSSIRTLNGAKKNKDDRNDLIFDYLRFVKELRPKTIMMENVPGLMKDWRISVFYDELEKLGYSINCGVLDAADYGVPQRRKRMILIASRFGKINFAAPKKKRVTVRESIGHLPQPGKSGDPIHDIPEKRSERVMRLIKQIPKDGGSRTDLNLDEQLECHKKCNGFKDVYGRMAWDEVAPTITGGCVNPSKGRFLHPEQNRAITLREAALLQSFPPDYFFPLRKGKYMTAVLIGNALPPEFIRQHALEIKKHLRNNIQ